MVRIYRIKLGNKEYPLGFKVVTQELKSLGLRKNPNLIQYPLNQWYYLPEDKVRPGKSDWGGIWVCRTLYAAKNLAKYVNEKYRIKTRIFKAALGRILYCNSYRIKTDAIFLFEEILI